MIPHRDAWAHEHADAGEPAGRAAADSARPAGGHDFPAPPNGRLAHIGLEALGDLAKRRDRVLHALDELAALGPEAVAKVARRTAGRLAAIEPSVTMIGQVKAGKTCLANAMIGMPDLLPSDVNPWTSVVTSLHLSPDGFPDSTRARFEFFGEEEWQRLVGRGGRLGELALRAGAEDELAKVHAQLEEMRAKSRARLGRRFEMLLSQSHEYAGFDRQLIDRYVVLGDDFDTDTQASRHQGRFADITRSADLFIERPDLPMRLCIRDTPGVNDTFLVREQITIRSIRESRLCVVVLSAHQALSSVDLALIRLIANVKSREVAIFVNRIDELADPGREIPEIEAAIRKTLSTHRGPAECPVIFGSALWAQHVLAGRVAAMPPASREALLNRARSANRALRPDESPEAAIWELSGIPVLMRELCGRIADGEGAEALARASEEARNLAHAVRVGSTSAPAGAALARPRIGERELGDELRRLEEACLIELDTRLATARAEFERRLERAHRTFIERATIVLIAQLEREGDGKVWEYDPAPFRTLLRTACQVFAASARQQIGEIADAAAARLTTLWRTAFAPIDADFTIEPPQPGRIPPPVQIGQTIVLDLKGSWWRRWWQRRRGFETYASDFARMIDAETRPMVEELAQDVGSQVVQDAAAMLRSFIGEQRDLMLGFAARGAAAGPSPDGTAPHAGRWLMPGRPPVPPLASPLVRATVRIAGHDGTDAAGNAVERILADLHAAGPAGFAQDDHDDDNDRKDDDTRTHHAGR